MNRKFISEYESVKFYCTGPRSIFFLRPQQEKKLFGSSFEPDEEDWLEAKKGSSNQGEVEECLMYNYGKGFLWSLDLEILISWIFLL